MRFLIYLNLLLIFSSCTWDVQTTPINGNAPLSDGNSKVWMVNHLIKNELDYIQPDYQNRDLILFYNNNKCVIVKWKNIGNQKGDKFYYKLNRYTDKNPILTLTKNDKVWKFKCVKFSSDEIKMIPLKGTDFKYEMTIIPIPEW